MSVNVAPKEVDIASKDPSIVDYKEALDVETRPFEGHAVDRMPESLRPLSDDERAAIAKRVVRKADLVIMYVFIRFVKSPLTSDHHFRPIICTLYILNCVSLAPLIQLSHNADFVTLIDIDRQNLSAAKLQGILEDLNMSLTDFATAVAILFVGYLPFQIPSNLIISRMTRPGLCAFFPLSPNHFC